MQDLDAISHDSSQPPTCDRLTQPDWQRANEIANELERAEFIDRVPELQKPWGEAHHPLLKKYQYARLAVEYGLPARRVFIDPFGLANNRADLHVAHLVQRARETGGLRRAADLWARAHRTHRDFLLTRSEMPRRPRQEFCVIDGQVFPVSQTPRAERKRKKRS